MRLVARSTCRRSGGPAPVAEPLRRADATCHSRPFLPPRPGPTRDAYEILGFRRGTQTAQRRVRRLIRSRRRGSLPGAPPIRNGVRERRPHPSENGAALEFRTAYGGFSADGQAYVITDPDTPAPWVNVICPGDYGVVVSQAGTGYSWLGHASHNRIT